MNALTQISETAEDKIGQILAILQSWKNADIVMLLMCGSKDREESKTIPKFLTV